MSPYFLICLQSYAIAAAITEIYGDDPLSFLFVFSRLL